MYHPTKRGVLAVTALAGFTLLGACTVPASVTQTTVPKTTAPVTVPSTPAAEPTTAKRVEPESIAVGRAFSYTKGDVEQAIITVTKVEKMTGKQAKGINQFNDDPKFGTYWNVTLSYEAKVDGFSPSSWDWKVKDDAGQEYKEAFIVTKLPDLPSGDLHAGEKATGAVTYDAPTSGARLIFQPSFTGTSLGAMPLA